MFCWNHFSFWCLKKRERQFDQSNGESLKKGIILIAFKSRSRELFRQNFFSKSPLDQCNWNSNEEIVFFMEAGKFIC